MAKLPPIDDDANAITWMMQEGRTDDAKAYAVDLLGRGAAGPMAQVVIAELFAVRPRPANRPITSAPKHWYEIALAVEDLLDQGTGKEEALRQGGEKFRMSRNHARRCWDIYIKARAESEDS